MKTPLKAELEAREAREITAARHRAAESFMAALVLKHGVLGPTQTEAKQLAHAAYQFAGGLTDAREFYR